MISPVLNVKNIDETVKFFTEVLGFKHEVSMEGPGGENVFAFVSLGKAMVGLTLDPENTSGGQGVEIMISVIEGANIDDYYLSVKEKTAIKTEIENQYWGDRTFTIQDINGYTLTFYQTMQQVPMDEIKDRLKQG